MRGNISYHMHYINNSRPLVCIFQSLINELRIEKEHTQRCIIFCQTRKQCALIYRVIVNSVFEKSVTNTEHATNHLVEMFHAGSPESVKSHVLAEMVQPESELRVLVCTIAFGMGINCKSVYRSIHFGPSTNIEMLVQETGRLGRDVKQCFCYVLHNGHLLSHSKGGIRHLVHSNECRRRLITNAFPKGDQSSKPVGCYCCDICSKTCDCSLHDTLNLFDPNEDQSQSNVSNKTRSITMEQREQLHAKLQAYRDKLLPKDNEFIPVGSAMILQEFDHYQINQVLDKCAMLFNINDITKNVELWHSVHANNVFVALSEVFADMDEPDFEMVLESECENVDVVAESCEDDSTSNQLCDTTIMSQPELSVEDSNLTDSRSGNEDISDIIKPLMH